MGAEGMSKMLENAGVGQTGSASKKKKTKAKANTNSDDPKQAFPHALIHIHMYPTVYIESLALLFGLNSWTQILYSLKKFSFLVQVVPEIPLDKAQVLVNKVLKDANSCRNLGRIMWAKARSKT